MPQRVLGIFLARNSMASVWVNLHVHRTSFSNVELLQKEVRWKFAEEISDVEQCREPCTRPISLA